MSSDQDDRALNYTRQMSIQDESSVEDDEVLSAIYSEDDLDDDNLLLEDDDSGEKEVRKMALKLSKDVWTWKFFVVLIILSTAGFLSAAAYYFITESETQDYEDSFRQVTKSVEEASQRHLQEVRNALSEYSSWITGEAMDRNMTFPHVTIPTFELHGQETLSKAAGVEGIVFSPLVAMNEKNDWEGYTSGSAPEWVDKSKMFYEALPESEAWMRATYKATKNDEDYNQISYSIVDLNGVATSKTELAPFWQATPPPPDLIDINVDLLSVEQTYDLFKAVNQTGQALFGPIVKSTDLKTISQAIYHQAFPRHSNNDPYSEGLSRSEHPHALLLEPVFEVLYNDSSPVVGLLHAVVSFDAYLENLLPDNTTGIVVVLRNSCRQYHTYRLDGPKAYYLGIGDLHDPEYDDKRFVATFYDTVPAGVPGQCFYSFHVYPSRSFQEQYSTNEPALVTFVIAIVFFFMALTFLIYDWVVVRRNNRVVSAAVRTHAIVSQMFPTAIRDRLLRDNSEKNRDKKKTAKSRLKNFVDGDDDANVGTKPIADLFPEVTVLFADIVGFTSWSSAREPSQVFTLLETVYHAFDEIAQKRRVFKVETVGDCYVAVTGLPDPRKDHAVVMCRFARDCMQRMWRLTAKLEKTLGPDTADLTMRMGLHSGPVTAGVLRGERSRFQLFGDTMNTAARMESNGKRDSIQVSEETAKHLVEAGKSYWIEQREDKINAKGKGELTTYWLTTTATANDSNSVGGSSDNSRRGSTSHYGSGEEDDVTEINKDGQKITGKLRRLVDWNVEVLLRVLREILVHRKASQKSGSKPSQPSDLAISLPPSRACDTNMLVDEVKEVIELPNFDSRMLAEDPAEVEIDKVVIDQLYDFVTNIALLYQTNPFHSFEHASHVTMSVTKLLSRIVAPSDHDAANISADHTLGIKNPLTQFACIFSALIHDCDHPGVPNAQLVKEKTSLAIAYLNQSVAEQNSIDIAWNLLMDDKYRDLRACIYQDDTELKQFRQLVVNSVMATDIVDKQLKELRNKRWDEAFAENSQSAEEENSQIAINRKATIVIEHLIQASDVAHTMQHWHIYRKWNERFFFECMLAYRTGRAEKDPSVGWYKGEIGFFDFYIIPLARKLKECGVFGVSSDEYLNYAITNRNEWEIRGEEVVAEVLEHFELYWQENHGEDNKTGDEKLHDSLTMTPGGW